MNPTRALRILEQENPAVVELRHPFTYERLDHPRLSELRRRYRLRSVVKDAGSEFEEFLLLRDWVKSRWPHGWNEAKARDLCDGITILEDSERGLEFCCGTYALVYIQCLLSLGHQARRISISKNESDFIAPDEGNVGHSVPEVWSNEWRKWILMDPDLNCHYEHDGTPLSALEIRRFWLEGRWEEVSMVRGESPLVLSKTPPKIWAKDGIERAEWEFEKLLRYNAMDYYHFIAIEMGNDYLTTRKGYMLGWEDEHTPARLATCNNPVRHSYTQCVSDIYWPLNHTHISLRCHGKRPGSTLDVALTSAMPNLDRFLVSLNGRGWRRRPGEFIWRLSQGRNTIRARSVNGMDREGSESMVVVAYQPA